MAQNKNTSVLKSNKLFQGIYDTGFSFKDKNFLDVKEGEVIYSRGDESEFMYLVVSGMVKFKTYENPRQPKIFLVSRNDFFGEKELLEKSTRNSSAVAEKDSVLFRINQKDFIKITSSNKKIFENLKEQKYEEVVAPSKRTDIKEDIFKRILETDNQVKKEIELKDYSLENPLLEMKARNEITEELKLYEDEGPLELTDKDIILDDDGITWDDTEEKDKVSVHEIKSEPETSDNVFEEIPVENNFSDVKEEDIVDNFFRIQEQVNIFSESIEEQTQSDEPGSAEKVAQEVLFSPDEFINAAEKISSTLTREETIAAIVDSCIGLVNAERGILYFPENGGLLKGKLTDDDTELIAGSETIPAKCFVESRIINIKDVFNDPDFNPAQDYITYFHIHNLICIPLLLRGEVKAVLQLFNNRDGEFSDKDEKLLSNITPVILQALLRSERYENERALQSNIKSTENSINEIYREQQKKVEIKESKEKFLSLKVVSEFLLQEINNSIRDIKQFNDYLQRIDIPGETKEISDIVTSQSVKIIDLVESLKRYAETKKIISEEKQSYINVFDNIVNLLAEYTEGRKVNLYKRFESDAYILADPRYLYLAVFQLIKFQCDLMPFGGNIFISSVLSHDNIEILIRNSTKKTDESLVISAPLEYNEDTPSGLGLSLSRRIIEDHNAFLVVKNQSGTGMEIGIGFPLA